MQQRRRVDPDACVAKLNGQSRDLVGARFDGNAPAHGREFNGVFDEIPKDLLETASIPVNKVPRGIELNCELEFSGVDIRLTDPDCLPETQMRISRFAMKLELAARHACEVEEVVDEMSLQIKIATHECERGQIFCRASRFRGEVFKKRDQRRKRGAQLMREHSEKEFCAGHGGLGQETLQ